MATDIKQNIAPRYKVIYDVLYSAICSHKLTPGIVLTEAPLAKIFGTSRVPVRTALELLFTHNYISQFKGRGFIVNPQQLSNLTPIRTPINSELLGFTNKKKDIIDTRSLGEQIFDKLANEISNAILYGHFYLDEKLAAKYFNVSRSVIRDAFSTLLRQGLVEKEAYKEWLIGPLTLKSVRENYEIRLLLEPLALEKNYQNVSQTIIIQMLNMIDTAIHQFQKQKETLQLIEKKFHKEICNLQQYNQKLAVVLDSAQSTISINQTLHNHIKVYDLSDTLREYQIILNYLLEEDIHSTCGALVHHLQKELKRSLSLLKVFSVIPNPILPPYIIKK